MSDTPKEKYTGPVVVPATDTYLNGTTEKDGGQPAMILVPLERGQLDSFEGMIETEMSEASKLIDRGSWDDRMWAYERLEFCFYLLESIGRPRNSSILNDINLND